ncbi:putative peptide methionine sulfoxide reductase (partial), partial [Bordetella avium 197N]
TGDWRSRQARSNSPAFAGLFFVHKVDDVRSLDTKVLHPGEAADPAVTWPSSFFFHPFSDEP